MKKYPLQKSIIGLFVAIFLFFCLMFAFSASIIGKNTNDDYKKRTAEAILHNAEATISASMTNYNYLTRLLMLNDKIVKFLKVDEIDNNITYEARKGIYEIQNLYSYIDSVFIFRLDGDYVSTERNVYYIDTDTAEYQRVMDARGATVVSINGNGMIRKVTSEPLLTLSRAIYDINSQKLIGMLVMSVSGSYFEEIIVQATDEEICVYDIYGNTLCGDDELIAFYENGLEEGEEQFFEVQVHGNTKIMAGRQKIDPFIILCTSGKNPTVFSADLLKALILMVVAFVVSIIVWMLFMTRNIARPIRVLSDAMEETQSSGWLKPIEKNMPKNEIGVLADNYNTMIAYLNELFNRQIENEKNMQKAEMRILQEQIKPHFLYNTIESISYIAVEENATQVHDALEHLGNFYRNFLSKGSREIPVKREIRITQDYLALQKLRYGDCFDAEYFLEDNTMDCIIPKLILQPLVENAIYHGIRPKGSREIIRISTKLDGEDLVIVVYDSGIGMDDERIGDILKDKTVVDDESSFGLAGTINRIKCFCGEKDVVRIRSEHGEYTEIEIRIPALWEKREK